ncbi:MAG TPA: AMP-binding protein [Gaiellaceae bacterium]|nr:AMP-binding protein [Gaiellaceae bacterium]
MTGILRRAAGTLDILRAWPGQRRFPYQPLERQLAGSDRRISDLTRYAVRHVPYYRSLGANDVRTAEDLARLPLISRAALLEQKDAFRSQAVHEEDGLVIRTSGTTGEPLDVLHDRRSALENIAYSERERAVDVALLGKRKYRALALEYSSGTLVVVRAFYDAAAFRPGRPGFALVPSEQGVEQALEALRRTRPDVVVGSGAWLEVVLRAAASSPRPTHMPSLVVYGGSGMSAACLQLVENGLGVPVVSRYNAGESLKIGYTCEERDGFHLHEDLCVVELVDPDGRPVPEGERGSVVISNLVNRGTVLLRYGLGDFARLTSAPCACGRRSRRLVDLEGKRNVILRLPDGTAVHSRTLWGVIKSVEGVRRFQIVQHEPARYEVRLVTDDRDTYERILPIVLPGLRKLLPGCEVDASWHAGLHADPDRRFETIVALDLDVDQ